VKNNPKLSNDFLINIIEISAGYFSPAQLDKFFLLVETEIRKYYFDRSAEASLLRIILGMYNKLSFLEECIKYPHYIEILVSISVNSNYLTDILVRDPEYFYWIVNPSNLKSKIIFDDFNNSVAAKLKSYKTFNAKINFLRALKRKEILRIGLKDILNIEDLRAVTEELSILAKAISANLFEICYNETSKKHGLKNINNTYCVIALGKLGGNELNYSSDIDLIVLFDKNIKIKNKIDYQDLLSEVILLFIETATAITGAGYIYRVDLRLRPDGKNSPLCNTFACYADYYESRGEDWERQMLIKGDFVTGDQKLYSKFYKYISHFIFPTNFSYSPLEQIRKMKEAIEKNLGNKGNIKLSSGGIRDIEFSVQALQLLNGGRYTELQTPNTLEAIKKLKLKNLFTEKEAYTLADAYIFYRKIEHYLQLMNDTQTHTIPTDKIQVKRLSSFLGFSSEIKFKQKINDYRKSVLTIYNSIIGNNSKKEKKEIINSVNFTNPARSRKNLVYLREGKGLLGHRQFDKKSIDNFLKIEPLLIKYLIKSSNPDIVAENFVRIISNASFPSIWYSEFSDKKFFNSFLKLCEYSQRSVNLFSEDKMLREIFLNKKALEKLTLGKISDLKTKEILFYLSVQITLNILSVQRASGLLSSFINEKIKIRFSESFGEEESKNHLISALGSFGSGEMTFASDIDLIFITKKSVSTGKEGKLFQRFLQQLKNDLTPFDVDCRLRPEGKSSQLVWNVSAYEKYITHRARTWEFQSFCKLKFVAGNKILHNRLVKSIKSKIVDLDNDIMRNEIYEMRKKLYPSDLSGLIERFDVKKSKGGLADIEFVLQFLMLMNHDAFKKLIGSNSKKILDFFSKQLSGFGDNKELLSSYYFLKSISFASQILYDSGSYSIILDSKKVLQLSEFLGYKSEKDFLKKLKNVTRCNQNLFEKYISGKVK